MESCPFCPPTLDDSQVVLENSDSLFLQQPQAVLVGSGLIIPRAHRETVFDLTDTEWHSTFSLLREAKKLLDTQFRPQGYNVGWNCGRVAGQEVFHVHLHVIPRFADEPFAGMGIRYWLKQPENRRRDAT